MPSSRQGCLADKVALKPVLTGKEADLIVGAEASWTINLPSCQIDQLAFPQTNCARGARAQGEHVILRVFVFVLLLLLV
jgi:hypothetical protein